MERQTSAGIIGALKAMAERQDSTATVTDLGLSVVVVHGTGDALIPVERARELVASAPRAKLVELAGIGHMPMLEAAQETATALGQLA
jgi:pimeloyl-ACP methyl ester carboxylesterase